MDTSSKSEDGPALITPTGDTHASPMPLPAEALQPSTPPRANPRSNSDSEHSSPESTTSGTDSNSSFDTRSTPPSVSPAHNRRWLGLSDPPAEHVGETFRRIVKPLYPIPLSQAGFTPYTRTWQQKWIRIDYGGFGRVAIEWREEPDIALIADTVTPTMRRLGLITDEPEISLLHTGGYNKVYTVAGNGKEFIVRIPLPVDPFYKIESDVGAVEFVRHFSNIPVPVIYAFDSSRDNPLGLEWMLMEKAPGAPLAYKWYEFDNETQTAITIQIADWLHELSKIQAKQTGAVYLRWSSDFLEFFIGKSVCWPFLRNYRLLYNMPRGPFDSLLAYYDAILSVLECELLDPLYILQRKRDLHPEQHAIVKDLEDKSEEILSAAFVEGDRKSLKKWGPSARWSEHTLTGVRTLRRALPELCAHYAEDSTFLTHNDVSHANVMVDDSGNITALLDWDLSEFQWPALIEHSYPNFLESDELDEDGPDHEIRQCPEDEDAWDDFNCDIASIMCTQLRAIYKKRLEELSSPLVEVLDDDRPSAGLRDTVHQPEAGDRMEIWIRAALSVKTSHTP